MVALRNVSRVRVKDEAAGTSTFAVEQSSAIADFKDVRCSFPEVTLTQEMLQDDAIVQRAFQERLDVLGQKRCSLSMTGDLTGTGISGGIITSTTIPLYTDSALGIILKTVLGGFISEQGSTEASGTASTASSVTVATGDGSNWVTGMAFGYVVGGRLEVRELDARASDALTPKVAFSATPADQTVIYNAHTYWLTDNPSTSLAFVVETTERDDIYWLTGCQATSFSINLSLGQIAKWSATFEGANWLQDDSAGTPLGGSAIAAGTISDGDPVPYVNQQVLFGTGSPAVAYANMLVDPSSIELGINIQYQALPSPGGVNGIRRWILVPQRPMVTLALTLPVDSGNIKTYQTARDSRTVYKAFVQVGHAIGNTVLLSLPSLQITDVQKAEGAAGLHGCRVVCKGYEDQDIGTASERERSPFRIHRF